MKIKRDALIRHLQRIACGGQIPDAVFTGAFKTDAMSADHLLLVLAPGLPKTKVLWKKGEAGGIPNLERLIKAASVLSGAGNEAVEVDVTMEANRLVVNEEDRGLLRLLTAAPKTIGSRVEEDVRKSLMSKLPKAGADCIPLTRPLVEGITKTFSLFKAEEIELFVGPQGGKIQVGNANADTAEFASEELKATKKYSLLFGEHFVDILGIVTDFNAAVLHLTGPDKLIMIDDGGYKYILAPRNKGADA